MFSKKVTDDDNFMSLSSSAQALYLHLCMSADDDGFCNQVTLCMFKAHASAQDLQALIDRNYIYQFETGVVIVKHWRVSNALRKDRYNPTTFQEELSQLYISRTGTYELKTDGCSLVGAGLPDGCQMVDTGLPDGCRTVAERLPQDSIGKVSIDKGSIDNKAGDIRKVDQNLKEDKTQKVIPPSVSPPTALSILRSYGFAKELESTVKDWLTYKHEKRQDYKTVGLNALLKQIRTAAETYGDDAVIQVIRNSMASNYQGITFDRLVKSGVRKTDRLSWIDEVVLE